MIKCLFCANTSIQNSILVCVNTTEPVTSGQSKVPSCWTPGKTKTSENSSGLFFPTLGGDNMGVPLNSFTFSTRLANLNGPN